eukprot:6196543-Pleurochrysis_carterae.AAC.1
MQNDIKSQGILRSCSMWRQEQQCTFGYIRTCALFAWFLSVVVQSVLNDYRTARRSVRNFTGHHNITLLNFVQYNGQMVAANPRYYGLLDLDGTPVRIRVDALGCNRYIDPGKLRKSVFWCRARK